MENKNPIPDPDTAPRSGKGARWLGITARILLGLIVFLLLVPVLIYVPPVQTLLKNIACDEVYKATGMKIGIGRFRLKFPADIALDGVYVLDASGDTMVRARSAVADIKLMPLLSLEIDVNRINLVDGYYRMVSADSSMIMRINAGHLALDGGSSMDIRESRLLLNDALLEDGNVSLCMNVWKQKKEAPDTAAAPFYIRARKLRLRNFGFAMSMLPTIDTLDFRTADMELKNGVIDLGRNIVALGSVAATSGRVTYLTPTPEFVKTHPVPADTAATDGPPSPPMTISGRSITLRGFDVLYAEKGHKPLPGFDASHISLTNVTAALEGFYNRASEIRLPITQLEGKERCGLDIVAGSGLVAMDDRGMTFDNLKVRTTYSEISATAKVSADLLAMKPTGTMSVSADASIGSADIKMFMPSVKPVLEGLPSRYPLVVSAQAAGSLAALAIDRLDVRMRGVAALSARGAVENLLHPARLAGRLSFDGALENTSLLDKVLAKSGISVPPMRLRGRAAAAGKAYSADFELLSRAGNVAANGKVNLTAESYDADIKVRDLDVRAFMPGGDIGAVSAHIKARGRGFNIENSSTRADISADITRLNYSGREYGDISARITLDSGEAAIDAVSYDPLLDFDIAGQARISPDLYDVDLTARLNNVDLYALGLSKEVNSGSGIISLKGTASPRRWLYDMTLEASNVDWNLPGQFIHLPGKTTAVLDATRASTALNMDGNSLNLRFNAASPLDSLVDRVPAILRTVMAQAENKNLDIEELQRSLPRFDLTLNASSRGVLRNITEAADLNIDTLYVGLHNRDRLYGFAGARSIKTPSLAIDTAYLTLSQRNKLMDYRMHVGNRPGTLDEFANVDLRGYLGGNRLSAFLTQNNIKGETGYRLGFTAAFADSLVSLHFTPLQATIGYKQWEINDDNHLDYYWTRRVDANVAAASGESRILLETVPTKDPADNALHVNLQKIYLQDFLQMSALAPPVTAEINSDLNIIYKGKAIIGNGDINVTDFHYDNKRVGTFDLAMMAGTNFKGAVGARFELSVEKRKAAVLAGVINIDSVPEQPVKMKLSLTKFPLSIANPFLGDDVAKLGGGLSGEMSMTGTLLHPHLNGHIQCDSVAAYIPMAATDLKFDGTPITVDDNLLHLDNFEILAANSNPLYINGEVNARNISRIMLDISAKATNIQLVGGKKRSDSQIYGPLFMTLNASAKGSTDRLDINANAQVLPATNVSYTLATAASQIARQNMDNVVKFVNFNDTTAVAKADSIDRKTMMMRIDARLTIVNGAQVTVNLSDNATDKVQLSPSGNMIYTQNYMGDMRLTGRLNLGNGFARYSIPVVGEKMFTFNPESYVLWQGAMMNPLLNISAVDEMKANVKQSGGNSRLINFLVTLDVTNTLENPKVSFDLSTNDDLTVRNELESMTPEQRSNQAMNLLLYSTYTGPDTKASANLGGNPLYSFLESQINSWASSHIRGVDLSFGIDQYDKSENGRSSTTTSYSYQLSKSLFSNRFKISVGGNYSTDANADENFAENLINDISFEYTLKQTNSLSMFVRLFRHTGYESILEGEVTETGAGFVMKRKLGNFRRLFRFGRRRKTTGADTAAPAVKREDARADTIAVPDTTIDLYDRM